MVPQRGTSGIAKGLELQGRKYETMDKFCYLGDMLAARGGETAAVTASIQSVGDPAKHREKQSQKTEERLISPILTQPTGKHGEQPSRK